MRARVRSWPAAWVVSALACGPAALCLAEPARYELDPEHVSLGFLVSHVGYANVLGFFGDVEGGFTFDEETGSLSELSVTVATESVFTNHDERDGHLRSRDFLDTRAHPRMTFTAASARRVDDRIFEIDGELELLGRTGPLTLTATWNKSADYPFGNFYVIGVSARGTFDRSAFGMSYGVGDRMVGDTVEVIVELEARRER